VSRAEILERKRLADIDNGKRLASINGAAAYCGLHPRTIRRRIADGTLTGHRAGPRVIRVDLNEVDERLLQPIPTAG
jgi:excisionase family DNA binding protein